MLAAGSEVLAESRDKCSLLTVTRASFRCHVGLHLTVHALPKVNQYLVGRIQVDKQACSGILIIQEDIDGDRENDPPRNHSE